MGAAAFGCMPKGDASKVEHKSDNKDAEGRNQLGHLPKRYIRN